MVIAARRRLVEHGLPEERLLRFPAEQVILLDEKREYEVRRDDTMKLMNLPVWQVQSLAADIDKANKAPTVFAELLVEGIYNVRKAQARLDQRIALLRHVEALRLYAADHIGSLPAKLSDVSVPLPDDPCHRQAVPLRGHRQHGAPPRHPALRRRKEPDRQRPLRSDASEVTKELQALDNCQSYILQLSATVRSPVFPGSQGMNASHSVCQESSRVPYSPLLRRCDVIRSSLSGRSADREPGIADPAQCTAGAGPKTGPPIPAVA